MIYRSLPLLFTVGLLAACTVGPDYHGAPDAAPKTLAAGRLPHAGSESSTPGVAQWWQALGDPQLNQLVAQAARQPPNDRTAGHAR